MKNALSIVVGMLTLVALAHPAGAQSPSPDEPESGPAKCFECHDDESLTRTLDDGTEIKVDIDPQQYKDSVHGETECTECHHKGYGDDHPEERSIASKAAMASAISKGCDDCHDFEDGTPHARFATGSPYPGCSSCHNPHRQGSMADWKKEISDADYCLACHAHPLPLPHSPGDEALFTVDGKAISNSVHADHACSDCHADFSKTQHAPKASTNTREHSMAMAQACMDCHEDKATAFKTSIHAKLAVEGNTLTPVCTDCHGFHDVGLEATMKTLTGQVCAKCHENVAGAYLDSAHGKAHQDKRDGQNGASAPNCSDCHSAHETVAVAEERMRETCKSCHENVAEDHADWLPNSALHLKSVTCTACHASGAQRRVNLKLTGATAVDALAKLSRESGRIGPRDDEIAEVLSNAGEGEFKTMLGVSSGIDAHHIALKSEAVSSCEACHHGKAESFHVVTIAMADKNGQDERIEVSGGALTSATTIASISEFYTLGGSRLPLFDWMLLLGVVGTFAGVLVHLGLRKYINKKVKEQASASVSDQIETFYADCVKRGLTGDQGVVVPASTMESLELNEEVIKAVSEGKFHIYALESIDDATA